MQLKITYHRGIPYTEYKVIIDGEYLFKNVHSSVQLEECLNELFYLTFGEAETKTKLKFKPLHGAFLYLLFADIVRTKKEEEKENEINLYDKTFFEKMNKSRI